MDNFKWNNKMKRTVLIIEDNEINREMLKLILEPDYEVLEAMDGLDGLEKMRSNLSRLSLVLLDVEMPKLDGYGFLKIYHNDEMLSTVPVIVTTGNTISESEEKCLSMGASDYVIKPYNPKIILRRIEAIIRLHESIVTLKEVEFDQISGLYTANAFKHYVKTELNFNPEGRYDLLMINVEDFGLINERLGEIKANGILKSVGICLKNCIKTGILCSRFHADRFVLMGDSEDNIADGGFIDGVEREIYNKSEYKDFNLKFAVYKNIPHDVEVGVLCNRLELALKTVKHQFGVKTVEYNVSMSDKTNRLNLIEKCMRDSLEKEHFKVYYQPKNDALTGKVVGAEALVRWIHPEFGFMSPADFIPFFEENGFISVLDFYVLKKVCSDLDRWKKSGLPLVPVSVNASRKDFVSDTFIEDFEKPVKEFGVDKNFIHIEITESLCLNGNTVIDRIAKVKEKGFAIEIDDFGSGYSSLGMLKDIPKDLIKLDMIFSREIEKQREIVQTVISLAHALGVKTVAEGVETENQLSVLRGYGCDYIQGYYFSKPLPINEFENYLVKNI